MSNQNYEAFLGKEETGFVGQLKTGGNIFVGKGKLANLFYILVSSSIFFSLLLIFKAVDNKSCTHLNSLANFMIFTFGAFMICSFFLLCSSILVLCCRSTCCGDCFDYLFDTSFTCLYIAKTLSIIFFSIAIFVIAFGVDDGCYGAIRNILLAYAGWHLFILIIWIIAICCKGTRN